MPFSSMFFRLAWCLFIGQAIFLPNLIAQEKSRPKHRRVPQPKFSEDDFPGTFFDDVRSQLVGSLPSTDNSAKPPTDTAATDAAEGDSGASDSVWKKRIDAQTIEDLVKGAKLRLDPAVSSPAKFASGGYQVARRDFTMLAILFGVIEQYPGDIRWKHSANRAKIDFSRIAANAKVGSLPAFNEAKTKNQLFNDLLNGNRLDPSKEEANGWADTVDRIAAMQLLEWVLRDNLNAAVSSEAAFKDGIDQARQYGQLTASMGEILLQEGMPDHDSDEYRQWTNEMISASEDIVAGATKSDLNMTREAISKLDKSCNSCHEVFR